jgi:hypothetical protein
MKVKTNINENARYVAYGYKHTVGHEGQYVPGGIGRVFHETHKYERLGVVAGWKLPEWIEARKKKGLPMPKYYEVLGVGRGHVSHQKLFGGHED